MIDQAQSQECEHDREPADEQWQRGGDQPAEHPEREQQQNRDGQRLGAFEVRGGAFVDFVVGDVVATEPHTAAGELGMDVFDRGG